MERMADDYERALTRATAAPARAIARPPHLAPDPWRLTREVLAPLGEDLPADLTA
jgi:hypothetical protein